MNPKDGSTGPSFDLRSQRAVWFICVLMTTVSQCGFENEAVECLRHSDCGIEGRCINGTCSRADNDGDTDSDTGRDTEVVTPGADVDFSSYVSVVDASFLTFEAMQDTAVRADLHVRTNDNYGCDPIIAVLRGRDIDVDAEFPPGAPNAGYGFIQFGLHGVRYPVKKALLRLTVAFIQRPGENEPMVLGIRPILEPWTEGNGVEGDAIPGGCTNVDVANGVVWKALNDADEDKPLLGETVFCTRTILADEELRPGDIVEWDVTTLVDLWLSGEVTNNGLALSNIEGGERFQEIHFTSKDGEMNDYERARYGVGPRLLIQE